MAAAVGWVELGRIGAPFGVRGWTHVDSYTDPPEGLLNYPAWVLRFGPDRRVTHRVAEGRRQGERLVVRLDSIEDRDAAAALTGAVIEVRRSELPAPGKREYYRADLIGFEVRNLEDVRLGEVAYFVDTASSPVMVVRDSSGREHWVLAIPQHLQSVELDRKLIRVAWPIEPDSPSG